VGGVGRDAAGAVAEDCGRLGVDPGLAHRDDCRGAPQDHRTCCAEYPQREAEAAEKEPRVAQRDNEPVPPSQRLEELYLLNGGCAQLVPPHSCAQARCPRPVARSYGAPYTSLYKHNQHALSATC